MFGLLPAEAILGWVSAAGVHRIKYSRWYYSYLRAVMLLATSFSSVKCLILATAPRVVRLQRPGLGRRLSRLQYAVLLPPCKASQKACLVHWQRRATARGHGGLASSGSITRTRLLTTKEEIAAS